MSDTTAQNPAPEGFPPLMAHLSVDGCGAFMDWLVTALGAEEVVRMPMPGSERLIHATVRIQGVPLYLADDFPEMADGQARAAKALGATPVTLHIWQHDVDAAFERAVAAGATPKMPPADMFWGDRYAIIVDPWGNQWSFGKRLRDMSQAEHKEAAATFFEENCGPPPSDDA